MDGWESSAQPWSVWGTLERPLHCLGLPSWDTASFLPVHPRLLLRWCIPVPRNQFVSPGLGDPRKALSQMTFEGSVTYQPQKTWFGSICSRAPECHSPPFSLGLGSCHISVHVLNSSASTGQTEDLRSLSSPEVMFYEFTRSTCTERANNFLSMKSLAVSPPALLRYN